MSAINKTKFAILGIISQKAASGYDIKKYYDSNLVHFWHENYGHIYRVLKTMETEGLISSVTEHNPGKPPRHIYSITEQGTQSLIGWLKSDTEYQPRRNEFLLKLVFSNDIPVTDLVGKIEKEKASAQAKLDELTAVESGFPTGPISKTRAFWLLTLRFYIQEIRSRVDWCTDALQMLNRYPE